MRGLVSSRPGVRRGDGRGARIGGSPGGEAPGRMDGWIDGGGQPCLCPRTCPRVSRHLLDPQPTHRPGRGAAPAPAPAVWELLEPSGTPGGASGGAQGDVLWPQRMACALLRVQRARGKGWDGTSLAAAGWTAGTSLQAARNEWLALFYWLKSNVLWYFRSTKCEAYRLCLASLVRGSLRFPGTLTGSISTEGSGDHAVLS